MITDLDVNFYLTVTKLIPGLAQEEKRVIEKAVVACVLLEKNLCILSKDELVVLGDINNKLKSKLGSFFQKNRLYMNHYERLFNRGLIDKIPDNLESVIFNDFVSLKSCLISSWIMSLTLDDDIEQSVREILNNSIDNAGKIITGSFDSDEEFMISKKKLNEVLMEMAYDKSEVLFSTEKVKTRKYRG